MIRTPVLPQITVGGSEGDYDAVILPVAAENVEKVEAVKPLVEAGDFTGDLGAVVKLYPGRPRRLVVVGAGKKSDWEDCVERIRVSVASGVRELVGSKKGLRVAVRLEEGLVSCNVGEWEAEQALVAALLAAYSFSLKSEKSEGVVEVGLLGEYPSRVVERARAVSEAVYIARDIANAPPSHMNPEGLEALAFELAKRYGVRLRVLHREDLEALGMGGILAVGSGSDVEPRLIIMEHDGGGDTYAIIGKAVTFDAGGLDLKPASAMYDMKFDKSGGAVAIGAVIGARLLNLPVRVVALVPAVENLPSGRAFKPRDVIRMYNGRTVEVGNTDAEGRLIMADALAYAREKFKPRWMVDIATLTGAIVVALGNHAAGLFANNDSVSEKIENAAWRVWEPVWRMPLWKPYREQLKSDVADLNNVGGREGGAITAAAFLSEFVDETPWAHLDVAGVAWTQEKGPSKPYYPKGATGWGVRTLIEALAQETRI